MSRIDFFPESDLEVIVVSNVNTTRFGRVSRDLAALALGKPYDVVHARKLTPRDSAAESSLAGTYVLADGSTVVVSSGDHFLEAKTDQFTAGLLREGADVFYAPFFEGNVSFTVDNTGRATSLNMHYNGEEHVARRSSP